MYFHEYLTREFQIYIFAKCKTNDFSYVYLLDDALI